MRFAGGLRVVGAVNGGTLDKGCQGQVADGYVHIVSAACTVFGDSYAVYARV